MKNNLSELSKIRAFTIKHNLKVLLKWKPNKFSGFLNEKHNEIEDRYITSEYKLSNDFYGIASSLKKYANYHKPLKLFLEHGVYFGEHVNQEEIGNVMPGIITYSDNRKEQIKKKSNIPVICIGPYINYVKPFYNLEEIEKFKKKYGKILLVFPQHTIEGISIDESTELLINKINEIKKCENFDNVFISLYYREVNEKYLNLYINSGFIPICSGNRQDPDFLARLKSFILMSSSTASNNVGTHIGYCYALNREHILIDTNTKIIADKKENMKNVPELYLDSAIKEKEEVKQAFYSKDDKKIKKVVEKYWGTNYNYTEEELKSIFVTFDRVYKIAKKNNKEYSEVLNEILMNEKETKEIFERKNIR